MRFTNQNWSYATLIHESAALKTWGENLKRVLKKRRPREGSSSCFRLPKTLLRGAQSGWEPTGTGCSKRSSLSRGTAECPSLDMFKTQLRKFLSNLMQLHTWLCFSKEAGAAKFHSSLPAKNYLMILFYYAEVHQVIKSLYYLLKWIHYFSVKAISYVTPRRFPIQGSFNILQEKIKLKKTGKLSANIRSLLILLFNIVTSIEQKKCFCCNKGSGCHRNNSHKEKNLKNINCNTT